MQSLGSPRLATNVHVAVGALCFLGTAARAAGARRVRMQSEEVSGAYRQWQSVDFFCCSCLLHLCCGPL
eukprot:8306565-Pyramimonas_sp.AAC.1